MSEIKNPVLTGLAEILGRDAFDKVLKYAGGTYLWIPPYENYYRAERNAAIRRSFYSGRPVKLIAEDYALSPAMVYEIISGYDKNRKRRKK